MFKKTRNHSVQEIVCNEEVEIRVDNRIKTNVKIQGNMNLIEVGITSQDNLQTVETENMF
ncbi:hypothetical protein NUSPORA_02955 [Nucleospora cyclopteri]